MSQVSAEQTNPGRVSNYNETTLIVCATCTELNAVCGATEQKIIVTHEINWLVSSKSDYGDCVSFHFPQEITYLQIHMTLGQMCLVCSIIF